MDSRSLNRIVTIESQSTTQDAAGQPLLTWTTVASVWANILHKNGAESIRSDRDTSIVQASIRIHRRSDVTPAMRVVHESKIYLIQAVLPDEVYRDHDDLVCERVS